MIQQTGIRAQCDRKQVQDLDRGPWADQARRDAEAQHPMQWATIAFTLVFLAIGTVMVCRAALRTALEVPLTLEQAQAWQ